MPWKLILFLLCIVATTFFVGFNLENSCNINLVFRTYENVPVFLTVLISFVSGVVIAFLFSMGMKLSKGEKKTKEAKVPKTAQREAKKESLTQPLPDNSPTTSNKDAIKKTSFFSKRKGPVGDTPKDTKEEVQSAAVQSINLEDTKV